VKYILFFTLLISFAAGAEPETSADSTAKVITHLTHWSFVPQGLFWQEDLEAKELGQKSQFHSQLFGISLGMNRTYPISSRRWVPFYTPTFSFGTLKSSGASAGHIDSFKNQPWYMAGIDLGVSYRPSGNSEIRLLVPAQYRLIQWTTSRSTLSMGQKSSYTTGVGIVSATKMANGSYLLTGFTHLYEWKSTLWHAGMEFVF